MIFLLIDSGTLSTSKQGNCLRLFELQSVSADAMRIVFDNMPDSFSDKINKYLKSSRISKRDHNLLSGIYSFFTSKINNTISNF